MPIEDVVQRLGLVAHPEGGWYGEVYRDAAVSTIHYVLPARGLAPLHRVHGRVELWHFYGGAPAELHTIVGDQHAVSTLGPDAPVAVVPPGAWQATRAGDSAAWFGCTVAPAFEFSAWELPSRAELLRQLPATLHACVMELTRT
ncbi:MAG: cupin domain-containing protein [Polyangia bacterium]